MRRLILSLDNEHVACEISEDDLSLPEAMFEARIIRPAIAQLVFRCKLPEVYLKRTGQWISDEELRKLPEDNKTRQMITGRRDAMLNEITKQMSDFT